MLVFQSCPTLCDPMDCSPPGSSVHGILQAWILEWVACPFSRGSSQPRDWTRVSCIAGRFFTMWTTRETRTLQYTTPKLTLGTSGVTPPVQASTSCFPFLPKNGSVSWQSLSRGQLVATQNFLTTNDQHILPWPGQWTPPSGVLLVTVILGRGLAWAPFLGLWSRCQVSFVDTVGASVQRLPAVAHRDASWLSLFVCSRGSLEQPWVHTHLLLNWRSEALCCCDLSQASWPLCDSASSSVTFDVFQSSLSQTFFCPHGRLTIVTASKVLPPIVS